MESSKELQQVLLQIEATFCRKVEKSAHRKPVNKTENGK